MPPAGFAVSLPFGDEAARAARVMVGQLLAQQGCPGQLVEDGRLVAHELIVNGVTHGVPDAHAEIALSCRVLASHVVISVLDGGHGGDLGVRPATADSLHGRGLAIVEALSDRWTVDRTAGTRVEAWLPR